MPTPIIRFAVVLVRSAQEATEVGTRITEFTSSPDGIRYMLDPRRAVVLVSSLFAPQPTLYLSDGALAAAKEAGLELFPTTTVDRSEIPRGATLLCGDQSDAVV